MNLQFETPEELRDAFIGWQCRIRQHVVRKREGQPSVGMRASVRIDNENVADIIVLLTKEEPVNITRELKFMVQKTQDPKQRYDNALKFFSEYYYQHTREFSDRITAVFARDSEFATVLNARGDCQLRFEQGNQIYNLDCKVGKLPQSDDRFQATYWHNILFNPRMPGEVSILQFSPDWASQNSFAKTA